MWRAGAGVGGWCSLGGVGAQALHGHEGRLGGGESEDAVRQVAGEVQGVRPQGAGGSRIHTATPSRSTPPLSYAGTKR